MIPYIEVVGKYNLKQSAIIEPSECWFELSYYNIGEFEIYAEATPNNINALKMGNYVKIPNKPYLWVIKSIQYSYNASGARMIDAKGYEAKWLITQRVILNPVQLSQSLGTSIYNLVNKNLGPGAVSYRKIVGFIPETPAFAIVADDPFYAPRSDLWEYLHSLLKSYECGSYCVYDGSQIRYRAFKGFDKTASIVFSQSMDNLITADYFETSVDKKTFCRVVSTFTEKKMNEQTQVEEEISNDYIKDVDVGGENIDRIEFLVQANISTKYTDASGQEKETTPTSALYQSWQQQEGKNQLAQKIIQRDFTGEIDLPNSNYNFEEHFFLGDIVTIRDEYFGYETYSRITKYTFKQDANGYGEEASFGDD